MASSAQICGFLLLPARKDALTRIQLTIGAIRKQYGFSAKEIAAQLKQDNGEAPDADTIRRAERGENLLSFDLIAQLAYLYGDCAEPIRRLLDPAHTGEPTSLSDRLDRIEREASAIRKELDA